ncbi:hypothetical protein PVBG_04807 [Plasmodium vivax Brazil I]|uniref:Uncharacterized protein n=1 Tax=Plasmodium vivax (strain Brazil I) TaxID=1033975 RepID=A0A0J9VN73_PLAV1|nr:hypothetical protein PVBG_04807 [Plasmodium vivax Brazil I]
MSELTVDTKELKNDVILYCYIYQNNFSYIIFSIMILFSTNNKNSFIQIIFKVFYLLFINKIWTLYDEFNETIVNLKDEKDNSVSMCEQIMQDVHDKKEWYKIICIKLIKNLGAFSIVMNKDKNKYNPERCKNLNSWLYYITKHSNVDQNVIKNIFEHSNNIIGKDNEEHHCINSFYMDIYNKPDDIIMLINLEEYKNDILKILKDNKHDNHCSCLKFIFECANIYREMKNINCTDPRGSTKKSNTCSKLQKFYTFYTSNISTVVELNEKLLSLDAAEKEHITICPSDIGKQKQELKAVQRQEQGSGLGQDAQSKDSMDSAQQSGSTIPLNGTALVGTMIGIPSFLALMYRVIL